MASRPGAGPRGRRGPEDRGQAAQRPSGQPGGGEPPLTGTVSEAAPAKVNLYLHVTGRRTDGYHLLDSLVAFAGVGDEVQATSADVMSLVVEGREAAALANEPDNLVLRAARRLAELSRPASAAALRLVKRLPVASGIGGGSADAAATLRALDTLWSTRRDRLLEEVALGLGADVPVCLASQPVRMMGIGEVRRAAPGLPSFGLVLANPRRALPTPAVFARRSGSFSDPAVLPDAWSDAAAMARDLAALRNDLEPAAITLCPQIAEVLAALRALPGCLLARMSGSGATCFGIFATPGGAAAAAALLPQGWWAWGGATHDGARPLAEV